MSRSRTYVAAAALALAVPAAARGQEAPLPLAMDDRAVYTYVLFDELELLPGADERPIELDGLAWIGGDFNKVWVKARGDVSTRASAGQLEGQLLYGRVLAPFWDAQVGLRIDRHYGDGGRTRGLVAVGIQGLAPYWFEVESTVFVSQDGDLSARFQASYDLLFTQRLIVEPELELNLAVQEVPAFGVGDGLSAVELGARIRYEIVREFAPYVGVSWLRRRDDTHALARGGVGSVSETSFVAGVRWWY